MSGYSLDADTVRDRLRTEFDRVYQIMSVIWQDNAAKVGLTILAVFAFIGLFGPYIAPHHPIEDTLRQDYSIMKLQSPSSKALLGTTSFGKDVLSQFLAGARPTLIMGFFGGVGTGVLGFLVGLTSG